MGRLGRNNLGPVKRAIMGGGYSTKILSSGIRLDPERFFFYGKAVLMGGYDPGVILTLLDVYGLFPSTGVFMKSGGDFLLTKYEKTVAENGDLIITLANTRQPANILIRFEQ